MRSVHVQSRQLPPHVLRTMIEADGGFTVDFADGRPVAHGISVCARPSTSLAFPLRHWDDWIVNGWLAERQAESRWRSRYIGGWLDPRSDTVWLDVVRVVSPKMGPVACLLGRAMQQHCVFDLGRRQTVSLRGGLL